MSVARVLVAEDDAQIRGVLADLLESEGYEVVQAKDGREALARFHDADPDVVLLDIMMPELSGYDVCRAIRKDDERVAVIMVTAKSTELDTVVGLQLGADDYIAKPFGMHELVARVGAVLRRARAVPSAAAVATGEVFEFADARIDTGRYMAVMDGHEERITATEMKIIACLRQHVGCIVPRNELLDVVWGGTYLGTTRTLDQHVLRLRKKVESSPATPRWLKTVHGVGYRLEPRESCTPSESCAPHLPRAVPHART
jgi:DNA-binding response OmpR family regulator